MGMLCKNDEGGENGEQVCRRRDERVSRAAARAGGSGRWGDDGHARPQFKEECVFDGGGAALLLRIRMDDGRLRGILEAAIHWSGERECLLCARASHFCRTQLPLATTPSCQLRAVIDSISSIPPAASSCQKHST